MKEITELLFSMADEKTAAFEAKLAPTLPKEQFIGVKVPQLRVIAKELEKNMKKEEFINELPHVYYEENLIHSILLSRYKPLNECMEKVIQFLPYVDNWAVCDTLRPIIFEKNTAVILPQVKEWIKSKKAYTCRFGIDMLMTYYLDDHFQKEFLELPLSVDSDEYYVKMMVAWYYATALAKQWEDTIPIIEAAKLVPWVHNKTIQKACESFRITEKQKEYLKTLKINGKGR